MLLFSASSRRPGIKKIFFAFILLPAAFIGSFLPVRVSATEGLGKAMLHHLSCLPIQAVVQEGQEISISNEELCLATIYAANNMKPLWVSEKGPGKDAAVIRRFLENAETEGLRPADYNVAAINRLWQSSQSDKLAELDTLLTINLVKYAHDVSHGRLLPYNRNPQLFAEAGDRHFKPVQLITEARAAKNFAAYLADLPPSHDYYRKLREALKVYRQIDAAGGWKTVANGKTLYPGDRDERIEQVRKRLAKTVESAAIVEDETLYDDQLVSDIKHFQEKFGLKVDGIIGPDTLGALNRSPEDLINAIILNMVRWRWQKVDFGHRYVIVNIANYDLAAVEDGRRVLEMAVIVGKLQHQTPVFSRYIQYVDINPFWNIPPSIAVNEELPELRKDRYYLTKKKVRLFPNWQDDGGELDSTAIDWQAVTKKRMQQFRLRQDPGSWNVLGPIKFVFPNEYDVYIHGTPVQELFNHNKRNFSHGCIRASRPLELGAFLLAGESQDWSVSEINKIIDRGERKVVKLTNPVPVHITYQTVWIDKSGEIHFNKDVYGRDRKLAEILLPPGNNQIYTTGSLSNDE